MCLLIIQVVVLFISVYINSICLPVLYNSNILWLFLVVMDGSVYGDSLVTLLLSHSNTDHIWYLQHLSLVFIIPCNNLDDRSWLCCHCDEFPFKIIFNKCSLLCSKCKFNTYKEVTPPEREEYTTNIYPSTLFSNTLW